MNRSITKTIAIFAAFGLMFQGLIPVSVSAKTDKAPIDVEKVRIPEIYGTVKEVHKGNDKVIFYLQDAHANLEAQQNNSRIIEELITTHGVDTVCVEGFDGPADRTKELANFPDKDAMRDTADYFLSEGRISGPQHLAITSGLEFELYGLEDDSLYKANRAAYTKSMNVQKQANAAVNAVHSAMWQVAEKTFSPELKGFISAGKDYRDGKIRFTEWADGMRKVAADKGVDISGSKNFALQGKTFAMETEIDFDAVEDERAEIVDEVSKKLSKEDTSDLVVKSLSFRLGRLGAVDYYETLKDYAKKAEVDVAAKVNLAKYIDYIKTFEMINKDALVDEANAVHDAVKGKLFAGNDQRDMDALMNHVEKIGKMFNVKLGIRDYKKYVTAAKKHGITDAVQWVKKHAPKHGVSVPAVDASEVEGWVASVEDFYGTAAKRDDALAKNAIAMINDKEIDRMAIVTGGFHTGGVSDRIKKAGLSLVVVTPRITDFDVKSPYQDVMMGKPTALEDVFAFGTETMDWPGTEDETFASKVEASAQAVSTLRASIGTPPLDNTAGTLQATADALGAAHLIYPAEGIYVAVRNDDDGKPAKVMIYRDRTKSPVREVAESVDALAEAGTASKTIDLTERVSVIGINVETADADAVQTAFNILRGVKGPNHLGAKFFGATANEDKEDALEAKIAEAEAARQYATESIKGIFNLGEADGIDTARFVILDDADLKDGVYFDLGPTAAWAYIHPDSRTIAVSRELVQAVAQAKEDGRALYGKVRRRLIKDVKKAAATSGTAKQADMDGLITESSVGYDGMFDLSIYGVATLVKMASEAETKNVRTNIGTELSGEREAFALQLAHDVQSHILRQLLPNLLNPQADQHTEVKDLFEALAVDSENAAAQQFAKDAVVLANFVRDVIGSYDQDGEAKIDLEAKTVTVPGKDPIAMTDPVYNLLKDAAVGGYEKIANPGQIVPAFVQLLLQAELKRQDTIAEKLVMAEEKKLAIINFDNAITRNADGTTSVNSANLLKLQQAMLEKDTVVVLVSDKFRDEQEIRDEWKRATGEALASDVDVQTGKIDTAFVAQVEALRANKGVEKGNVAFVLRETDDVDAVAKADYKYVVGQPGVSLDLLIQVAFDPGNTQDKIARLVAAGVDSDYAAEVVNAAETGGHLLPPSAQSASTLINIQANAVAVNVAA